MSQKRRVPSKGEPDSHLKEEPKQPVKSAPAVKKAEPAAKEATQSVSEPDELTKKFVDELVADRGIDEAFAEVAKAKVVKLRNLAREYDDLPIVGREISKANKATLLEELKKYYGKNN